MAPSLRQRQRGAEWLWCVLELFVFLRVGGSEESIVSKLLEPIESLSIGHGVFNARDARCADPWDKETILAVLEASFGTVEPFNRIVRGILQKSVVDPAAAGVYADNAA